MTDTKHTPGPWGLITVPTSIGQCHKIGSFPGRLKDNHACIYDDGAPAGHSEHSAELLANAHLIAATPELLEALEDCVEFLQRQGPAGATRVAAKAREAIAKAKGETQ